MKFPERIKSLLTLGNGLSLLTLLMLIGAIWWLQRHFEVNVFSETGLETFVDRLGWYGPLGYIFLIAVAVVVSQLPGVPLTIAAGAIWGPLWAGIYSVVGAFIGGVIAYWLGRTLGRSTIKALTGHIVYFSKDKGDTHLGWIIFVSRLVPFLSFDIISYAAGITKLRFSVYAIATFLGVIPSTLLLTYLGSSFSVSPVLALALSALAALLLIILPILIKRYNWFGLGDFIHIE